MSHSDPNISTQKRTCWKSTTRHLCKHCHQLFVSLSQHLLKSQYCSQFQHDESQIQFGSICPAAAAANCDNESTGSNSIFHVDNHDSPSVFSPVTDVAAACLPAVFSVANECYTSLSTVQLPAEATSGGEISQLASK